MSDTLAYNKLIAELRRLDRLGSIGGLLGWDEMVNLPKDSADYRAEQNAHFAALLHRESTSPALSQLIGESESQSDALDTPQRTVVEWARRDYDRATKLPKAFVEEKAEARSHSYHAWVEAREKNRFDLFEPHLSKQVELAKREAAYIAPDREPYDYWLDQFDPDLDQATLEPLFSGLKDSLVPLVSTILESDKKPPQGLFKSFPVPAQKAFLSQVVGALGFNFDRGRIDASVHPFCGGNGADTRMTTRFDEDNPLDSLFSSIHETGHALYEQGLPRDHFGTALGEAVGMAVHESQSRIWENQVARSREFWHYWEPQFRAAFSDPLQAVNSEDLFRAINAVELNPIRVDSDEVTYNLHIILRFEIEKGLFSGEFPISELPAVWNQKSSEIIGLTPTNDAQGVLQDVHWSEGLFGYFPSYCLGNMLAAQLWEKAQLSLPGLLTEFRQGRTESLLSWLRETIHQHGKQFNTQQLTQKSTGKPLSYQPLINYLKERYLPLYT